MNHHKLDDVGEDEDGEDDAVADDGIEQLEDCAERRGDVRPDNNGRVCPREAREHPQDCNALRRAQQPHERAHDVAAASRVARGRQRFCVRDVDRADDAGGEAHVLPVEGVEGRVRSHPERSPALVLAQVLLRSVAPTADHVHRGVEAGGDEHEHLQALVE